MALLAVVACFAYKLYIMQATGSLRMLESYQQAFGFSSVETIATEDVTILALVVLAGLLPGRLGRTTGGVLSSMLIVLYLLDILAMRFFNARLTFPNLMRFAIDLKHARGFLSGLEYALIAIVILASLSFRRWRIPLPFGRGVAALVFLALAVLPWILHAGRSSALIVDQATLNLVRINLQVVVDHDPDPDIVQAVSEAFPEVARGVSDLYSGAHLPSVAGGALPNIVLLISESLSRVDSRRSGGVFDRLPRIDEVQRRGLTLTNAVANGFNSSDALAALLLGADPLPTDLITGDMTERFPPERFAANNVVAAARALGYTTIAMSNAPLDFQHNQAWLEQMGFQTVHGASSHRFAGEQTFSFGGPSDVSLYAESLKSIRSRESPLFVLIFTVGLHKPYTLPDEQDRVEGDLRASVLGFVDRTTQAFYEELDRSRFFDKGVLLLVGDHRRMDPLEPEEIEAGGALDARGRVVAALLGKGIPAGGLDHTPINHTDMNGLLNHLIRGWPLASDLSMYSRAEWVGLDVPMTYNVVDPDRGLVSMTVAGTPTQVSRLDGRLGPDSFRGTQIEREAQAMLVLSTHAVAEAQRARDADG